MKTNLFWKKLREYFTVYLPKQRNSSEKTITSCQMAWNLLLRFLLQEKGIAATQINFDTFTSVLLADFLNDMETRKGWKASTRNNRLSCIRSFFKYAAYTCPNVYTVYADLGTIPLKKEVNNSQVVEYMSKDAVASIIECAGTASSKGFRDQFFLTLMYDTAARNGEMLKLKLSDINTDNATIYLFGKGSKPRLVPVSKETLQMFGRYRSLFHNESKNDSPLFYTRHRNEKTPMSDDNVARFLKGYAAKARTQNGHVPANVHPHMFRHSRAMHLYQGGMPLAVLSEFLGHEDPETTLIYAYADTEMKRQAIEKASANALISEIRDDSPIWETQDIIERLIRGY
jgi:site-specific recombinase XerD